MTHVESHQPASAEPALGALTMLVMAFHRITAEPDTLEGKPCIRGLRISVETVVRLVAAGWSFEEIVR